MRKIRNCFRAIYLCARFPFLYPRNRFSNQHYTDWDYCKKTCEYFGKHTTLSSENGYEAIWDSKFHKFVHSLRKFYHDTILQIFHCIPTYTELDDMPNGWRKAFGIAMCKELKAQLKKDKFLYSYRITQIKEKYGTLHWYSNFTSVNIDKIIMKYEYISKYTCIVCGEPATGFTPTEYWKAPYCDEHFPKNSVYKLDYGIADDFYGYTGNINRRPKEEFEALEKVYKDYVGEEEKNEEV